MYPSCEALVRLACFAGVLFVMAAWEIVAPRRQLTIGRPIRWLSNLGLVALNTLVVRVLFPLGVVGIALFAAEQGWGLFNYFPVPWWFGIPLTILLLDLVIYLQHVLFHAVPALWRLHMVHHADLDIDFTTGVRFHTIEILLSMGIKGAAVLLLGPPALGVLAFEVLLNATSLFNHGNVRLPPWFERLLRLIMVTPDMHRVHHSIHAFEANSNFGFNLPWWDFLFGTYRSQPVDGHEGMTIGLSQFRNEHVEHLPAMLVLPFVGDGGTYPINRERPSGWWDSTENSRAANGSDGGAAASSRSH